MAKLCNICLTVFISMVNITCTRKDSCLDHLRFSIKQDTLNALKTVSLNMATLSRIMYSRKQRKTYHSLRTKAILDHLLIRRHVTILTRDTASLPNEAAGPAGKNLSHGHKKKDLGKSSNYTSRWAKGQSSFK